ncbi:hypothetical protein ACCS64_38550, partial [Rhizobium ruizarguesonis]
QKRLDFLDIRHCRRVTPPRHRNTGGRAAETHGLDRTKAPRFWSVTWKTTIIAFVAVSLQYVIGFSVALALRRRVPGEGLFRVRFLVP